jgi:hypothetical protein
VTGANKPAGRVSELNKKIKTTGVYGEEIRLDDTDIVFNKLIKYTKKFSNTEAAGCISLSVHDRLCHKV